MDWETLNNKIQRPVFPKASISNVTFSLTRGLTYEMNICILRLSQQQSFFVELSRLDILSVFNICKTETRPQVLSEAVCYSEN